VIGLCQRIDGFLHNAQQWRGILAHRNRNGVVVLQFADDFQVIQPLLDNLDTMRKRSHPSVSLTVFHPFKQRIGGFRFNKGGIGVVLTQLFANCASGGNNDFLIRNIRQRLDKRSPGFGEQNMRCLIIRRGEEQKIFTLWHFYRPRKEIALAFALQGFAPRAAQHRLHRDIQPFGKKVHVIGKNTLVRATLQEVVGFPDGAETIAERCALALFEPCLFGFA